MSEAKRVLIELRTNGAACSRDIAEAIGIPLKRVSTYLTRLGRRGLISRGDALRDGSEGRPAVLWWPR